MRIGLVCPYAFDIPGGVQLHVRDLAEYLLTLGHEVSVLAPVDDESLVPSYVVSVGRPVSVPYNGSVARLAFGPRVATRVGRWVESGNFDVIHVHEPMSPSVSMLALRAYEGPIAATFHTATLRSRAMTASRRLLRPGLEKVLGRIAVSAEAKRTLIRHLGGDAVIIPNGVYTERFGSVSLNPAWVGTNDAPTIAFLGRWEEPRKGFSLLVDALPALHRRYPGLRLLVAGPGEMEENIPGVEFLGLLDEQEKAQLLASVDVYVAPNTGGESFGIILVEAMAAGAAIVASDLPAFAAVLDDGNAGVLFETANVGDLTDTILRLLGDEGARARLGETGRRRAVLYDWSRVALSVVAVYETVIRAYKSQPWPRRGRRA